MKNLTESATTAVDVVVIGGGAAGLNGALLLARSRHSVVVVDAGQPRNAPAEGVHGLLGREGTPPADLLATERDEVRGDGGQILAGEVIGARRDGDGFAVALADGTELRVRRSSTRNSSTCSGSSSSPVRWPQCRPATAL